MQTDDLTRAVRALKQGNLVVYPTDTLYALGADIFNEQAVRHVFAVKQRPFTIPLPVAVPDLTTLQDIAWINPAIESLVHHFLPGPLTMVLTKKPAVPSVVTGGGENIAIRIPKHPIALALTQQVGPLTVTSANLHGRPPSSIISDIAMHLRAEDIAVYLDAGPLQGQPSTIIDMTTGKPRLVRQGRIRFQDILDAMTDE
jgi:L-threonylcarbamoyladenylate synthase